ncbi:MAG: DUF4115 domain-containing protein [Kurthia sp.]|uniref:Cytoskeletal protein RodZ n=1 Tax=Kurthia zopfii TaxID=1650 RepID=A0A2U3AE15_9BACL|nr:RodZ domain-containing protein [Kurthia zopfii]PWI22792.1 DUF4115 domain-containing protein [Kurthia zopfii]TDR41833.1 cytoskeletal protein RodZ [Kurthia zopfii]STX09144.1 cytoskeletal protein RodZ [Kurthia zopfii]VEI08834.1 cytoskeletal protein RodZ [Kurthia zopfii]GEK31302.1 XRE family transcriptional regulator [Kurthia zopfii]
MTELGNRLKEARLSKGFSLDDLQEKTKIQKRYLSAIEEGNYAVMPGTFYVRAFIKQYAEAVDLDAHELLETYKSELPTSKVAETLGTGATIEQGSQSTRRTTVAKSMGQSKKFSEVMPKFVVALFIIIAVAVAAFLMLKQPDNNGVEDQKEPAKTQENSSVAKDPEKPAKEEPKKETPKKEEATQKLSKGEVGSDGVTTTYTLSKTADFKIRVDVTGDNWIGLTDESGATIGESGMFSAGDKIEADAKDKKSVRIRLGAAANGKIFVNGKEVKLVTPVTEQTTQNIVIKLAEKE